jgi:hypothetical protein
MLVKHISAACLMALAAFAVQPIPELRVEPTAGGSIFYVKNGSPEPLTAFLIELVDYPGSYYALWQDEVSAPIAPGAEKRIQIANMTVGAVPDYVKMQAAVYADGTSSGIPEKATQLIERRRFTLATTRELIGRLEKAQAAGTAKAAAIAELKQWSESMPPQGRPSRNSQAAINQAAGRSLIADTVAGMDSHSLQETLAGLRAAEHALAASKPPL